MKEDEKEQFLDEGGAQQSIPPIFDETENLNNLDNFHNDDHQEEEAPKRQTNNALNIKGDSENIQVLEQQETSPEKSGSSEKKPEDKEIQKRSLPDLNIFEQINFDDMNINLEDIN